VVQRDVMIVEKGSSPVKGSESLGLETLAPNQFVAGSIHAPDKLAFWAQQLGISASMQQTLMEGYQIPWSDLPQPYEAPNNKSCRDNLDICREIVNEMAEMKVVEFTNTKPVCVNPLGIFIIYTYLFGGDFLIKIS